MAKRSRFIIAIPIFLVTLVVAASFGLSALLRQLSRPDAGSSELGRFIESCESRVAEFDRRPDEDRKILGGILAQTGSLLGEWDWRELEPGVCAGYLSEQTAKLRLRSKELRPLLDRLDAAVDGGLHLRFRRNDYMKRARDYDELDNNTRRMSTLVRLSLLWAAMALEDGKPSEAARRYGTLMRLFEGLVATPSSGYVAYGGVTGRRALAQAVLNALPRLATEDIASLADQLSLVPDVPRGLAAAASAEFLAIDASIASLSPPRLEIGSGLSSLLAAWGRIPRLPLWLRLREERIGGARNMAALVKNLNECSKSGKIRLPLAPPFKKTPLDFFGDKRNAGYGRILEDHVDVELFVKSLVAAMREEIRRRGDATRPERFETPIDRDRTIVVDRLKGCVHSR